MACILLLLFNNNELVIKNRKKVDHFGGELAIKKFSMGSCSALDLSNYISRLEDFEDFKADVVICDYADIMKSISTKKDNRDTLNETYIALKQIADENYPDDPSNDYRDERNAVFLSPDPKFTRHFSVEGYTDTGQAPTTYPVHVQARNPFDFDKPKHRENLWKTYHDIYYNPESELYAHGPHDTASEKTLAEMRMNKRINESHKDENNWPLFENPKVQEAIQDMGHDSFYIKPL